MRTGKLDGQYGRLGADERYRLFVAAEGRSDEAETQRLQDSCPQLTYRGREVAFVDRLQASAELTLLVVAELYALKGRLDVVAAAELLGCVAFGVAADEAEREAFRCRRTVRRAVRRAVRTGGGRFRRGLRPIRATLLTDGATIAHAFAGVCSDTLGVDPSALVSAAIPELEPLFSAFLAETPDPAAVDALQMELKTRWLTGIGEPPPPTAGTE